MDSAGNLFGADQPFEVRTVGCVDLILDQTAGRTELRHRPRPQGHPAGPDPHYRHAVRSGELHGAGPSEAVARIPHVPKHKSGWSETWVNLTAFARVAVAISRQSGDPRAFLAISRSELETRAGPFRVGRVLATIYMHFMEMRVRLLENLHQRYDGEADHQPLPLIAAETGEEATPEVAVRY